MKKHSLTLKDIFALGFMTFALFVGAGNIVYPPMLGIQSGQYVWITALGFLVTAVGLPVITLVALAIVGGNINTLSKPIGKVSSLLLSTICYLTIGPLFAIPRTATVSFEVGVVPLIGSSASYLFFYTILYFIIVISISLYPNNLLDTIGHFLAPIKIFALVILGIATLLYSSSNVIVAPANGYNHDTAFTNGFLNGYLTMDALGALVFGIVIMNAIRSRGIEDHKLLRRYIILAGLITGVGLTLVYLSLFKLGLDSGTLVNQHANGAAILHAYIQHTFGNIGSFFLALLIFIACIVTAVGLTCSCATFFSQYIKLSYTTLVFIISIFSMATSNLGLDFLIKLSVPVLSAIYPPCIVLVLLTFTLNWWNKNSLIIAPTVLVSFLFSIIGIIYNSKFQYMLPNFIKFLPLSKLGLSWLCPSLITLFIFGMIDVIKYRKS